LIANVAKSSGLLVEVGGGIRSMEAVEYYLSHGVNRVILGSAAVKNPQLVIDAVKAFDDQIAVGIDAKNGMVQAEGWLDNSDIHYMELAKRMEDVGVRTIIFTDIDQDGMLSGPNLKQLDDLAHEVSCNIIASGGVTVLKDILNLSDLDIYGAICGKSIYSGTLDLKQAIEMTRKI
jgi:phosphoribosylformimino-5-aminoimidazole carboxamide ribotide isomerase